MFAQFQITCMCILCEHMCWGVKHILRENTTISIANLLYSAGFGNSRPLFQYLVNFTWLRTKWDRYWCVLHKGVHVLLWRAKARCWRIANDEKGKHRLPGCIRKPHVKCHGLTQILFPILHLKLQTILTDQSYCIIGFPGLTEAPFFYNFSFSIYDPLFWRLLETI